MSEPTLAPYLRRLTKKERMHIIYCINGAKAEGHLPERLMHFHAGMLPMLEVRWATFALSLATARRELGAAMRGHLRAKLRQWAGVELGRVERFSVALNDGKVVKKFGNNLHRGIPLPGHTKRVTAGLKWSLPKKSYIPDEDVTVLHHFTLVKKGTLWEVAVDHRFKQELERYLIDTCI